MSNLAIGWAPLVLIIIGVGLAVGLLIAFGNGQHPAQLDAIKTAGTIVLGTGGAAALWLTARRQQTSEIALNQKHLDQVAAEQAFGFQQRQATDTRAHLDRVAAATEADAEARRITDLYTKAADQLGSDKAPVRLAGLYALERVAQDNPGQRQTIVNVICAYLRMPYDLPGTPPADDATREAREDYRDTVQEKQVRLTAQRILATHLRPGEDPDPALTFWPATSLDLTEATLIDFDLSRCRPGAAVFTRAQFTGPTNFRVAQFAGTAWFYGATFASLAEFHGAQFAEVAEFSKATFASIGWFVGARFAGAARFDSEVKFASLAPEWAWVRLDVPDEVADRREWPEGWVVVSTAQRPAADAVGAWGRLAKQAAPDPS